MQDLLKRWQAITFGYLVITYLAVVVVMKQPIATWLIVVAIWLMVLILTYLGTFLGIIGVLLQSLTRRQQPSIPLYKAAYKIGTRNSTILTSYGLILLRDNDNEIAMECFDRALENTTYFLSTKTLKCNKAIALWKVGRVEDAIALYNEVIEKFGKDDQRYITEPTFDEEGIKAIVADNTYMYPQDFTTLGFLYTLNKQYEEAIFFSQAALEKKENFAAAYDNLGQIDYFQGRIDDAEVHFDKALSLNPKLPDSLYFAGLVAIKKGAYEKALDYLAQAKQCSLDGLNTITYEMIDDAIAGLEDCY